MSSQMLAAAPSIRSVEAEAHRATAPGAISAGLSRFHVIVLAFQRAKQLQNGARPRVEAGTHRPTRLAMLEVMADTVSWTVLDQIPVIEPAK